MTASTRDTAPVSHRRHGGQHTGSASTGTKSMRGTGILVLCACLAQVTIVLDTTIIAVALPDAQADLGFADSGRQWAITAYTLAFGSLLLIGGRISQFLGIRRAFLIGLLGFGLASLAGGFAGDFGTLIAARAGQGVFAALLAPTNLSLMNSAFPDRASRAKAFAIFGAVAGAGAALGLILGGVLTESLGWRWCLFVNVPLTLLTAALAARRLTAVPGPTPANLTADLLGLGLGSAAVFSIVFGFSRADTLGWSHGETVSFLVAGVLLVGLFILREATASEPVLPLSIIRNRTRASSYAIIGLVGLVQMGSSLYLTFYFQESLGFSALASGFAFLPMVGGLIVAAVLSTRVIVPRLGLTVAFVGGGLIQAAGLWWLSQLTVSSGYLDALLGPIVIIGLGLGMVMAPAMSAATHGIGADHSGLAAAVANTSQQVGASLGVAFLSTFAATWITDKLLAQADRIGADTAAALVQARQPLESPAGQDIANGVLLTYQSDVAVLAYGAGFGALALIAVGFAAFVAVLRPGRSGSPSNLQDEASA